MSALVSLLCLALTLICFTTALGAAERTQAFRREITATAADEAPPPSTEPQTNVFQAVEVFSDDTDDDGTGENRLRFFSSGDDESFRQMRERLADPEQRRALRAEQRASLVQQFPDLGEVLGIDATTQEQVFDQLADRQMSMLDGIHRRQDKSTPQVHNDSMQAHADAETAHLARMRTILGEEGVERWQDYNNTIGERIQVGQFDERLDSASKLRPEQREKLVAVFREHMQRELQRRRLTRSSMQDVLNALMASEDVGPLMRKHAIAEEESRLRDMPESNRLLADAAAPFLTPAQLAAFSRMNEEKVAALRRSVEKKRVQAGLSAEIPEQPESAAGGTSAPQRAPVTGDIKVMIKVVVNRAAPTIRTHTGRNGEVIAFEAGDGLWAEATPTLFDDQSYDVTLAYYEQGRDGKRRRVGQSGIGGETSATIASDTATDDAAFGGSSGTVTTGSKGYYIRLSAVAAPL